MQNRQAECVWGCLRVHLVPRSTSVCRVIVLIGAGDEIRAIVGKGMVVESDEGFIGLNPVPGIALIG